MKTCIASISVQLGPTYTLLPQFINYRSSPQSLDDALDNGHKGHGARVRRLDGPLGVADIRRSTQLGLKSLRAFPALPACLCGLLQVPRASEGLCERNESVHDGAMTDAGGRALFERLETLETDLTEELGGEFGRGRGGCGGDEGVGHSC